MDPENVILAKVGGLVWNLEWLQSIEKYLGFICVCSASIVVLKYIREMDDGSGQGSDLCVC